MGHLEPADDRVVLDVRTTGEGRVQEIAVLDMTGTVLLDELLDTPGSAPRVGVRWTELRPHLEELLSCRRIIAADPARVRAALRREATLEADEPCMKVDGEPDPIVERWLASFAWVPAPAAAVRAAAECRRCGGGAVDGCRALLSCPHLGTERRP